MAPRVRPRSLDCPGSRVRSAPSTGLGCRLTVGLQTLTLPVGVRIPAPQPISACCNESYGRRFCLRHSRPRRSVARWDTVGPEVRRAPRRRLHPVAWMSTDQRTWRSGRDPRHHRRWTTPAPSHVGREALGLDRRSDPSTLRSEDRRGRGRAGATWTLGVPDGHRSQPRVPITAGNGTGRLDEPRSERIQRSEQGDAMAARPLPSRDVGAHVPAWRSPPPRHPGRPGTSAHGVGDGAHPSVASRTSLGRPRGRKATRTTAVGEAVGENSVHDRGNARCFLRASPARGNEPLLRPASPSESPVALRPNQQVRAGQQEHQHAEPRADARPAPP
jgi:hypothetical protein